MKAKLTMLWLVFLFLVSFASIASATVYLLENFDDGDYTSNPAWNCVQSAQWDINSESTNFLQHDSSGASGTQTCDTELDITDVNALSFSWRFSSSRIDAGNGNQWNIFDASNNNAYFINWNAATTKIELSVWTGSWNLLITSVDVTTTNTWYDLNLIRSYDGNWQMYLNNVFQGSYVDTNFDDFNSFKVTYNWGLGGAKSLSNIDSIIIRDTLDVNYNYSVGDANSTGRLVDLNSSASIQGATIIDYNWLIDGTLISYDENITYAFPETRDFNVCHTVRANDGQVKQHCKTLSIIYTGLLTMHFRDENSKAIVQPTVMFNNITQDTNSNGFVRFDLNNIADGNYTAIAVLANYGTRYFTWDLDEFSVVDVNIVMAKNSSGRDINFTYYQTNKTTLMPNTFVEVDINGFIASRRITNTSAGTSFFLNPLVNYDFNIADVNIYKPTKVTVNVPRDETDLTIIGTDFNVDVGNLAQQLFTNKSAAFDFNIFSNTSNSYKISISTSGYFERQFYIQTLGNTDSYILSPLLVKTSQTSTVIKTESLVDFTPIPNVTVNIYRFISGEGRALVETVVTDNKGEALISGITNQDYDYEVIHNNLLVANPTVKVTSSQVLIQFNPITLTDFDETGASSVVFSPVNGILDENSVSLSQILSFINFNNLNISQIQIYITEHDSNGTDVNIFLDTNTSFASTMAFTQNLSTDLSLWDKNNNITVHLVILYSNGATAGYAKTYAYNSVKTIAKQTWDIITGTIFGEFGCTSGKPCGLLMLFAIILTIAFLGVMSLITPVRTATPIASMSVLILGFFTFITWIPFFWFIIYTIVIVFGIASQWAVT